MSREAQVGTVVIKAAIRFETVGRYTGMQRPTRSIPPVAESHSETRPLHGIIRKEYVAPANVADGIADADVAELIE